MTLRQRSTQNYHLPQPAEKSPFYCAIGAACHANNGASQACGAPSLRTGIASHYNWMTAILWDPNLFLRRLGRLCFRACICLGCLSFQLRHNYFHLLVASIFRQMSPGRTVLCIACFDCEVLLFPVRKGERALGVRKKYRNGI